MKFKGLIVILAFGLLSASVAEAQRPICRNGRCWLPARPVLPRNQQPVLPRYQPPIVTTVQDSVVTNTIVLSPVQEQVFLLEVMYSVNRFVKQHISILRYS